MKTTTGEVHPLPLFSDGGSPAVLPSPFRYLPPDCGTIGGDVLQPAALPSPLRYLPSHCGTIADDVTRRSGSLRPWVAATSVLLSLLR